MRKRETEAGRGDYRERIGRSAGECGQAPPLSWQFVAVGLIRTPFSTPSRGLKHFERIGRATVEIFPDYEADLEGIGGFSHLWLTTLSREPPQAAPDLHCGERNGARGAFATRTMQRPNPIGLLLVELVGREGRLLRVQGARVVDGTPLLDIRPYQPDSDCVQGAQTPWPARRESPGRRGAAEKDGHRPNGPP